VVESGIRGEPLSRPTWRIPTTVMFCIPGKTSDSASAGCNALIKTTGGPDRNYEDLEYHMDGSRPGKSRHRCRSPFQDLTPEEQSVLGVLESGGDSSVDLYVFRPVSGKQDFRILLELELGDSSGPCPEIVTGC